jgi:sugar phosphate isomerase/epimerase
MLQLAAFADEISPELDVQIEHCQKNGVSHFELRGVRGTNVLDFDKPLRQEIKQKLADNGMGVISIGSPIGKVPLHEPFDRHLERFKVAVERAHEFEARFIRLFSYYPIEGTTRNHLVARCRDEVIRRMHKKIAIVRNTGIVLVHENEANIFGEQVAQCLDLHRSLDCPQFKAAFDFANFIQAGEEPLANWRLLKPFVQHIHIKDARRDDGHCVPAGQGDGQIGPALKDAYQSGYRGFLTLEPHLSMAGQFSGFSGPELFKVAVNALRTLCAENKIPLAGA